MSSNERQPTARKQKCHNCGVPCWGPFCCEWCTLAYAQRMLAHNVKPRRSKRSGDAEA
jgi:hypothetical protein